jgi:hypothetical protein
MFKDEDGNIATDDAETCATMLDHSFNAERQTYVLDQMAEQWVEPVPNTYASQINFHQVLGDDEAAAAVLKEMIAASVEPNLRVQRLSYRKPKKLAESRTLMLRHAVDYGLKEDATHLFETYVELGVAVREHYTTMMFSIDKHADQMAMLGRAEAAGGAGMDWDLHPDAYAAQFIALQNEDRYEDVRTLLDSMIAQGVAQNDKTIYALKRAGERMRKQRRAQSPDRMSWDMDHSLETAPRRKVGL